MYVDFCNTEGKIMQNIHRLLLLIAIIVTITGLTACGSSASNTGTNVPTTPTTSTSSGSTPTPSSTSTPVGHFKVGQTVNVGNIWQIIIVSAKNGGTASYLKPDQVFLNIFVKAKNISSSEQTMSSLGLWTVRDTDGNIYQPGYDPNAGSALDGKVEAGQPLQGSLTFVVSEKIHQYILLFEADFISPGQTIWDIHV
jgi:hypothetical protein